MKNKCRFMVILALIAYLVLPLGAQAIPGKRLALVIGNAAYKINPLSNPVNDAKDVAEALRTAGFDPVILKTDLDFAGMSMAIDDFATKADRAEAALVYYSGHAAQANDQNYLIPVDMDNRSGGASPDEKALKYYALPLGYIAESLESSKVKSSIFILDACRSYPVKREGKSGVYGLSAYQAPEGTATLFATRAGDVASDGGAKQRNSVYTAALLKRMLSPGMELSQLAALVAQDVREATDGKQKPSFQSELVGLFQLVPESKSKVQSETLKPQITAVKSFGSVELKVSLSGRLFMDGTDLGFVDAGVFILNQVLSGERNFTLNYADGTSESLKIVVLPNANAQISFNRRLDEKSSITSITPALRPSLSLEKVIVGDFLRIIGGLFMMGSPDSEFERGGDEIYHQVSVSSFYIGKYEVTQAEWVSIMGTNPSGFKGDRLPVENVSWYDTLVYCNKRSIKEGRTPCYSINGSTDPNKWGSIPTERNDSWDKAICNFKTNGYRLPTEAEWEYSCRAGSITPFYTGNNITTSQANYNGDLPYNGNAKGEYREKTLLVGSFLPNNFGLYDMHGNVFEWCWDWNGAYINGVQNDPVGSPSGTDRICRSGSWINEGRRLRSAGRSNWIPWGKHFSTGFRLSYCL